jgi:cell division protein FtsW
VAVGLLLRVSYELDRAQRQVARLRGEAAPAAAPGDSDGPMPATPAQAGAATAPVTSRGLRKRPRVEPTLGAAR